MRTRLLIELATLLPSLRVPDFDARLPDQYGQIHHQVVAGAFEAVLDNDDATTSATLLGALLAEMEAVVARRVSKGDDQAAGNLELNFGIAEPFMVVMELSGYALALAELGAESWTAMEKVWGQAMRTSPSLVTTLLVAAELPPNTPLNIVAGAERALRFEESVRARGFDLPTVFDYGVDGDLDAHPGGPILSVYQSGGGHLTQDIQRVFVAEYLRDQLPKGVMLDGRTREIDERLARYRQGGQR